MSANQDAESVVASIFSDAFEAGLVSDGVLAASMAQRDALWAVRESIPDANRAVGSIASHDVSLPLRALPAFIDQATAVLDEIADLRVNCFGHLGDGNLHFNVFPAEGKIRSDYGPLRAAISEAVHGLVKQYNGSVSAEHGVGRLKTKDLPRYKDPVGLHMMAAIKRTLDPNGIMNPGVIIPE